MMASEANLVIEIQCRRTGAEGITAAGEPKWGRVQIISGTDALKMRVEAKKSYLAWLRVSDDMQSMLYGRMYRIKEYTHQQWSRRRWEATQGNRIVTTVR